MKEKITRFIKQEAVLCGALILASVLMILAPPGRAGNKGTAAGPHSSAPDHSCKPWEYAHACGRPITAIQEDTEVAEVPEHIRADFALRCCT